jgi:hypothetical protein
MIRLLTPALLLLWTIAAFGADAPAPAQGSNGGTLSNPLAAQPIEAFSAIVDRPLFSPSRHGAPAPLATRDSETRTPPPPQPNLVLTGVVMDGTSARVIVLVGPERKIVRAEIGDEIGGWTVSQISGRELVLSLGGQSASYTLFDVNRDAGARIVGTGSAPVDAPQPPQQQKQHPSSAGRSKEK